jgi:hypothetical protein
MTILANTESQAFTAGHGREFNEDHARRSGKGVQEKFALLRSEGIEDQNSGGKDGLEVRNLASVW